MNDQLEFIATSFVEIADHLVGEFDVVDLLSTLAERCAQYVDASEVGFILRDADESLQVVGASSEKMQALELFELQSSEGPCYDCIGSGLPLLNHAVDDSLERWPAFVPQLQRAGISAVHAFPMRLRNDVIGAMNIFHVAEHNISPDESLVTQAFADAATIAILQDRALRHATELAEQLQHALESRIVVEQAKGVLAERLAVDMDIAFGLLRSYARQRSERLSDIAAAVIERRITSDTFRSLLQ